MARRSAGTGARTPTESPPGFRPAGRCRSGPVPERLPSRPSAARTTTTDAAVFTLTGENHSDVIYRVTDACETAMDSDLYKALVHQILTHAEDYPWRMQDEVGLLG